MILANLLKSSVDYDRLDPVLTALSDRIAEHRGAFLNRLVHPTEGIRANAESWVARLDATAALVDRLHDVATGCE